MQIYVGKNGQQLGPFSLEEINRKLADGAFAGSDLAWYEGATGWAPLSGVAGVVIPSAPPASTPAPPAPTPAAPAASAPTPVQPPPAPAAAPVRSSTPIVQRPTPPGGYRTLSLVSWILLGLTLLLSLVPFIGCGTWFLAWPVAIAAIVMGIIVLTRGGTGQGIAIILAGVLIVPLSFVGQVASLMVVSHFSPDKQHKTQIRDNLRMIANAKNQFVTQTKAVEGAPLTMAGLTTYLSGKEIKPAVGEQYDPMPVGKAPTATLPATKTLGKFKGGDVLTAEMIDKDLAEQSSVSWYVNKTATGGNTVLPAATPAATVAPALSPSPAALSPSPPASSPSPRDVNPSPKPSVTISPNPTSPPRSLISPRQSVAPNEPPSSSARPSPSAKFAPRDGPRQTPSQPEESSGLRQGKQHPGNSPAPSPEDDDE